MQRERAEGRNESAKGRPSKALNDRCAWRAELEFIRDRMALPGGVEELAALLGGK